MRALGPALLMSLSLWAALAWCLVATCTVTGVDRVHLGAHDLGAWLLGIDLVFFAAAVWFNRLLAVLPN